MPTTMPRLPGHGTNIFQEIGTANAVLESLQASPNKDNLQALIAETRALRAYGYYLCHGQLGQCAAGNRCKDRSKKSACYNTESCTMYTNLLKLKCWLPVVDLPSAKDVSRACLLSTLYKRSCVHRIGLYVSQRTGIYRNGTVAKNS